MPQTIPTPHGRALADLRESEGWTKAELAAAAGLTEAIISALEWGRQPLTREGLDRLAEAMGCGPDDVEAALLRVETRPDEPNGDLVAPSPAVRRSIRKAGLTAARTVRGTVEAELTRRAVARWARRHRGRAAAHWERVRRHPADEWRARIDETPEEDAWALAELICEASEKAAAADVERTLALADLARHAAGHVPRNEAWRRRLQGFCWAFIGNARRVGGKLVLADQAFEESERLWKAGEKSDPGILDEGRLLDMKASLRRAQRRFPEALKLHEQALSLTPPAKQGYILVNKSRVHEALHDHKLAIELLQHATSIIDRFREPRLVLVAQFNLAVNLCHLDLFKEAEQLLPEISDLADRLGNSLDLVRFIWLRSWVATGLGKPEEAIAALTHVRREFAERGLDYDVALASLELAVLYLEQGFHAKVRILAREMAPIFEREQVHREALAALRLFTEAVVQETATADLARRIVRYLRDARHAPEHKFEP